MKQWYALHTKPRAEQRVHAALQQQELEAYLPELICSEAGLRTGPRPFFPRYLFIRLDLAHDSSARWRWTPGLLHVVTVGDDPAPVPESTIALIRRKLEALNARGGQASQRFEKGERVRICSGPFAGMLAIFDTTTSATERVRVLLDFLGAMNPVQLPADAVEKAPAGPKRPRRTRGRGRRINQS